MADRIPNTTAGQAPPRPPVGPGGRPYLFELVHAGWRGYADTYDELVGLLIDGYDGLVTERARLAARLRYAADVQVPAQAAITATAGPQEFESLPPAEREALTGPRDQPPAVARWTAPVPLVLVTSFYQPDGEVPRPEPAGGEVIWLDPSTDETLLVTLHEAGWIALAGRAADPA